MDEGKIINGLKEGDQQSFKELVDGFQLQVINTCLGIVHNRHDAEDIAQDVFIEIFHSIRHFRAESKLSSWIYRIAINKSLNYVRKQKRQKWIKPLEEVFLGGNGQENNIDSETLPSSEMEYQQRMQHLHIAMDALPDNQRIAFILNKYDELSYHEISEVMNLSISSVESLIHRAKVNLQKKLWACYQKECL